MNPKKHLSKIKIITILSISTILLIFLILAGLATAGWVRSGASLTGFLPVILRQQTEAPISSPGALIVFSSSAQRNGSPGGRSGMNDACVAQDATSHFCSLTEIEAAWVSGGVRFQSPFYQSWVDNPYLGTVVEYEIAGYPTLSKWKDNLVCYGWSTNNNNYEGTTIDANGQGLNIELDPSGLYVHVWCSEMHNIACCRYAP